MSNLRLRLLSIFLVLAAVATCSADETTESDAPVEAVKERLIRLSKEHEVWVDPQRKLVVVDGEIAMREGPLEMFACPKGSKEHESVVAVHSSAKLVHAGLLAVGAEAGHPVQFDPKYVPATGTTIDIFVLWQDEKGRHKVRAQEWIKDVKTEKAMEHDWVFGGSSFWTDQSTGEKFYNGDGGDFICLSNFSTATLDLPIESSQANNALLFSAFTEHIPPRDTKVRLVLIPRLDKDKKSDQTKKRESTKKKESDEILSQDNKAEVQQ